MFDVSCSSFCSHLLDNSIDAACTTADEIAQAKSAAMHQDPYAMELVRRLAIAEISLIMSLSFCGFNKRYPTAAGEFWVQLAIVCLEDKTFGRGLPGSIVCHPVLEEFPALRDINKARTDALIVTLAKRFQAAFGTMSRFHPTRPQGGISSFDRLLQRIDEPEDLWIVIAGLSRTPRQVLAYGRATATSVSAQSVHASR